MIRFSDLSIDSILGKALRLPLKLLPQNIVMPIIQGPGRGMRWIVGSQTHGMWLGSYEASKQIFISKLKIEKSTVFDIGANVGFYSIILSRIVGPEGRVIAFEPLPRNVNLLNRHIKLNKLENIIIYQAAVSEFSGCMNFNDSCNPSQGYLTEGSGLRVKVINLDSLIDIYSSVVLVKIDVEGSESQVLKGGEAFIKINRPIILLSTHGEKETLECQNILKNYAYTLNPLDNYVKDNTCSEWVAYPQ